MSRLKQRRIALAVTVALVLHLLAMLALGWRTPTIELPAPMDTLPSIELSLVRIKPEAPAASAPAAGPAKPSRTAPTEQVATKTLAPPAPPTPSSALAAGPADCEPEDLPLLTDAERVLCHNQIEVEKGRRLAQGADARAARQVAEAKAAARIDTIPAEKRAEYDAVIQANAQPKPGPPMTMHGAGAAVSVICRGNIPILGGVEVNPNLFAKLHKQEHRPHGPKSCTVSLGG